MKGFILAGGEGTRLYPLTLEIPKPLLPVGKIPVITYLVELYLRNGINDIKISIQKKHLEDFYKWRATYFPKGKINFLVELKGAGTFTPIIKLDSKWFSEPIVVSNGDELKELDLKKMIDFHKRKKGVVTIGVVKVKNPQSYGSVKMKEGRIIEFIEKAKNPPSSYINSGLYIISPIAREYFQKGAKFSMLETDLFPKLAKERKLFGYKWEGKWMDVGTWERWEKAIKNWNQE
ncbi:MAG: nucleotidyltransferase family protein [Patescibacteria group bacterium]|nr:nucleotidyltransferase family protein [Patescibacteria group bacterium]